MKRFLTLILIGLALVYLFLLTSARAADVVDSYSESNYTSTFAMYTGFSQEAGMSFAVSAGGTLDSAKFYIRKSAGGSPTGNLYAVLYAHSGVYGTSSLPTGSYLAISDAVDATTLPTDIALVTFTFSGANRVTLSPGYYVMTLYFDGGDASNAVRFGYDDSSPSHGGNMCFSNDGSSFTAETSIDAIFYVYKVDATSTGQVILISRRDLE
jgi:hypothetical protein